MTRPTGLLRNIVEIARRFREFVIARGQDDRAVDADKCHGMKRKGISDRSSPLGPRDDAAVGAPRARRSRATSALRAPRPVSPGHRAGVSGAQEAGVKAKLGSPMVEGVRRIGTRLTKRNASEGTTSGRGNRRPAVPDHRVRGEVDVRARNASKSGAGHLQSPACFETPPHRLATCLNSLSTKLPTRLPRLRRKRSRPASTK